MGNEIIQGLGVEIGANLSPLEQGLKKGLSEVKGFGEKVSSAAAPASAGLNKVENSGNKMTSSLKTNVTAFKGHLSSAATSVGSFAEKVKGGTESVKSGFDGMLSKAAGFATLAAGGFGLFELGKDALDYGNDIYELSQKLHISGQEAEQMNEILKLTNTDAKPFISTVIRLDKSIEEAGKKGNATTDALKEFGLKLTDGTDKLLPMNKQLDKLAEGYSKAAKNGMEEEYVAQVLGARGQALIPLLADYADAKEAASKITLFGVDKDQAHEAKISLMVLQGQVEQLGLAFADAFLPVITDMAPKIQTKLSEITTYFKNMYNDPEFQKLSTGDKIIFVIDESLKNLKTWMDTGGREKITLVVDKFTTILTELLTGTIDILMPTFITVGEALGEGILKGIGTSLEGLSYAFITRLVFAGKPEFAQSIIDEHNKYLKEHPKGDDTPFPDKNEQESPTATPAPIQHTDAYSPENNPLFVGPKMANGGIVKRATVLMAGEGREPEAITPLSKLKEFVSPSGAGGIHFHFNNPSIQSEADAEQLLNKAVRKLKYLGYSY